MTDPLMVVITSGSQREVVTAYRDALRRPHHREFWLEVNQAIIDRWSVKALGRIKREAWREEFYGDGTE